MQRTEIRKNRGFSAFRRDWRNDPSTPEVPQGHPKRKQRKKAKASRHAHIWIEEKPWGDDYWWKVERGYSSAPPSHGVSYYCSVCLRRKSIKNPRYSYEYWKWTRDNGIWHTVFTNRAQYRDCAKRLRGYDLP